MRKSRKYQGKGNKAKKSRKALSAKQGAWKSFWERYCQM